MLKPSKTRSSKLKRECCILTRLHEEEDVDREEVSIKLDDRSKTILKLEDVVQDAVSDIPILIFGQTEQIPFLSYRNQFTLDEAVIKAVMQQVLVALEISHSKGIMHRDVKPNNVMIDVQELSSSNRSFHVTLIDWGLSDFFHPGRSYNVRVASRQFKSPELLVNQNLYDYSLDTWSLGCMFAGMLFDKEPFLKGKDNLDQLQQIVKVLGTEDFNKQLKKQNIKLTDQHELALCGPSKKGKKKNHSKKDWKKFVNERNGHLVSESALDLLSKMLDYDHNNRILPREALDHDQFKNN